MKRTLAVLVIAAAALCGVFAWGASAIYAARDQVEFTETVFAGDRAAAEGLQVLCRATLLNNAFWDSTVSFQSGRADADTAFTYHAQKVYGRGGTRPSQMDIYKDTGVWSRESADEGMRRALEDVLAQAEPGRETRVVLRLADYCPYYPFTIMLTGQDFLYIAHPGGPEDTYNEASWELYQKFRSFFRIPVLEDEYVELTVRMDEDGSNYATADGGTETGDAYALYGSGVCAEDAAYLYLSTAKSRNGAAVDFSQVPGGFGLYRLPVRPEEDGRFDGDGLAMVYSLSPETQVSSLSLIDGGDRLVLETVEEGVYTLTVIDRESMEAVQRLKLFPLGETDWVDRVENQDALLYYVGGKRLMVVEWADGRFHIALDVTEEQDFADSAISQFFGSYTYPTAETMAWDGERLALVWTPRDDQENVLRHSRCGFRAAVYDREGLRYFADFSSSLERENRGNAMYCRPIPDMPLEVRWS